ncbi:MAG TPA: hypothetical protein VHI53_10325 [Gaiellaceae bacterium]|nr:hypothetical protein [Gaiellaceae bacterium]
MPFRSARELSAGRFLAACTMVAAAAAVGVAVAGWPLPRITPDSASYLTGAEMLADDGRFDSCDGPIAVFAPGYSAAMAPLVALGADAPEAARIVNALATVAIVLAAAALAAAAGLSRRTCLVVAIAVAVAYATLRDGALAWSEPLFCAVLGAVLVAVVGDGRGLPLRLSARLVVVVVLAWALLLTRHSGIFVVPAVVAGAWLGSGSPPRRVLRIGAFTLALLVVPALWWARNVHVEGDAFGRRSDSRFGVLEVLGQLPDGLSSVALPDAVPEVLRLAVLVPVVLAAALAVPRSRGVTRARLTVAVLAIAAVVYGGAVTLAATRTVVDPIDTRLMSPLLVPVAALVAVGVAGPVSRWPRLERVLGGFALALVALTALLAPGVVWRGHQAERTLATIPDDVSCAEWPASYSAPG